MWEIELQFKSETGLSRQIFLWFRERILTGRIPQREAMPSTRELARELGVSRNTVCEAYEMLMTEGFIVSRQGAPTRVAEGLDIWQGRRESASATAQPDKAGPAIRWDFKTGQPDLTLFPWQLWSQCLREASAGLSIRQLGYNGPKGYEPLCEEIARWLLRSRGMDTDPGDIFITAGATQALHLLVDLLYEDGRAFALESPSHPGVHTVIADRGYPLHRMPVDAQGADIGSLEGKAVSAVYVTPSHQFPLGGILPAGRRAALIRLAQANGFYIIEDDYDSEFRYSGSPVSPIYSMDSSHTVYVGTFSKTLFPALRLGFAVLPKPLHGKWRHLRNYMDVQNPIAEQVALAEFLRGRKMDRHVQRMRRVYGDRRKALLESINNIFGDSVRPWGDASGLHVALQFPGAEFGDRFMHDGREAGIRAYPLTHYCPAPDIHKDKLLLGYGHLSREQIQEGIRALRRLMENRTP